MSRGVYYQHTSPHRVNGAVKDRIVWNFGYIRTSSLDLSINIPSAAEGRGRFSNFSEIFRRLNLCEKCNFWTRGGVAGEIFLPRRVMHMNFIYERFHVFQLSLLGISPPPPMILLFPRAGMERGQKASYFIIKNCSHRDCGNQTLCARAGNVGQWA